MKDYLVPSDATGLEEKLHNGFIKRFYHKYVHPNYVIRCHDVFIEHDGKILVVTRDEVAPGIGLQWPIGGYITRGMHTEDSLVKRVEKECGLDIYDISFMGTGRTFFGTDPAGHGFGTDSLNLVYFARAKNKNVTIKEAGHKKPEWINEDHLKAQKAKGPDADMCDYTRDFMELAFQHARKETGEQIVLREYPTIEPGEPFFGLDQLKNGPPEEIHSEYHSQIVLCVDYLILKTPEGVILGKSEPVSGTEMLWPIGGLLKRGYETESSVRESVPEGWQISDIKPIGPARLFFSDDPFGKDKGTDVLAMGYAGNLAEIPADLGSNYQYVPRTDFRTLHPFIQDMLDL